MFVTDGCGHARIHVAENYNAICPRQHGCRGLEKLRPETRNFYRVVVDEVTAIEPHGSYFSMRLANCEFLFLDTRGHRQLALTGDARTYGGSLLGQHQKAWLKQQMTESDADCFFVVSSVNFMIPHVTRAGTSPAFINFRFHDLNGKAMYEYRDAALR